MLFPVPAVLVSEELQESLQAEEVVVTATRTGSPVEDIPASVEVITEEELEAKGAEKLSDALKLATGISLTNIIGREEAGVSIRGFKTDQVLILVDGRRLSGDMGGGYEIDRLSIENVKRIEVIRGPMSALYGSEALGGVVNIVTKQPEGLSLEVNPELSSYVGGGLQKTASLFASGPVTENLNLSGSVSYIDRDPYKKDGSELLYNGRYINASLKSVYEMSPGRELVFDAAYMNELVDPESVSQMTGTMRRTTWDDARYDASVQLTLGVGLTEYRFRGYFSYYDKLYQVYDLDTGQVANHIIADRYFPAVEAQVTHGFYGAGDHLLTAGLEYRADTYKGTKIKTGEDFEFEEEIDGKTYGGATKTLHYAGAYVQDEWNPFPHLLVVGSLRYDQAFEIAGSLSPKIGLTFTLTPGLRVKGSYGRGFRSPDVEELYYDFTAYMGPVIGVHHVIGNPDLEPETSHSIELSVEGETDGLSGKATWFYNDVDNLIEAVIIGGSGTVIDPTVSQYRNIRKARFRGLELEARAGILENLTLSGSYALLEAVNLTDDERLWERPRHKVMAQLGYTSVRAGIDGNLYLTWNGSSIENGEEKSWALLDASLSKSFGETWTVYTGADNLLNIEDEDIPLLGMNVYGGVRLTF
jgi:outer membrane receptor for ferrienterochelin and colicins